MVGLNPSRFYGRMLPRPRIYCDVKFSNARVDPPESVNAALLEWAGEATWKMGGTAAKRKRMSGKIEGRMSKLRAMEESDDEEDAPPVKKSTEKKEKTLGFTSKRRNESPASVLPKHATPIERMLETPGARRGKLAPRRIVTSPGDVEKREPVVKAKLRRSRKEQVVEESDDDSDDDIEGFIASLEETKQTPRRSPRKSARLQESPTASQTPQSKKHVFNSPAFHKRKRAEEVLGSESESQSDGESDSVYL